MCLGIFFIALTCFAAYGSSLKIGFLLDDFYHVNYVAQAISYGQWNGFLSKFISNWSDTLTSFRPAISVSYLVDYCLYGIHAWGYHLTNILFFFGCCVLTGLIAFELTGPYGNRLKAAAALWSALLFSVYPLHTEAVAWIIGRVDVFCGFFYLASVYLYLRFRLLKEKNYLVVSLAAFLLALLCKEMAVTLPLVILAAELLLFSKQSKTQESTGTRAKYVISFFVILAVFSIFRFLALGTLVGGYGSGKLIDFLRSLRIFLDRASLFKIFNPHTEEVATSVPWTNILLPCYLGSIILLALRFIVRSAPWRPFLFLVFWTLIMIMPTFQIWHINPNLVGARLFFLSSAPFCILLSFCVLPTFDKLSKRMAAPLAVLGGLLLSIIFISWSLILSSNLLPWISAGNQMSALHTQVLDIASRTPAGKQVLFLNVPQDYKGAGMLGREQYLKIFTSPPFSTPELSAKIVTLHQPSGNDLIANTIDQHKFFAVYKWSDEQHCFICCKKPNRTSTPSNSE